MPHRLLIYHSDSKTYKDILSKKLPLLRIDSAERPPEALDVMEEVEILFSWQIPDDLLKRAKSLKWFFSTAAGNENLVKNPSFPESAILTKTTIYGEMMAEYVFAYLLYFIRDLSKYFEEQRLKIWSRARPGRLRGKTMGLLGLGSVGKTIAKFGKQFGMDILGVKRNPGPVEHVDQVMGPEDLVKVMPRVDTLVVALPLTPETFHLLGEKELGLMKTGAVLFNIGRGKTIDEKALLNVLKAKKIKAVLDVFEDEPLSKESELWGLENVIITPHVSGINMPEEICEEFVRNYERWVKGEPLFGLVDREKGY
jgi:phosphoglycerate dehydrogenase-like enzyme